MSNHYFWLSEKQFSRLAPLLPRDTRGVPRVDDRCVISGVVHVLKSGGRWADAPAVSGPFKTLYNRFVRWVAKGIWADIFHALASADGPPAETLTIRFYCTFKISCNRLRRGDGARGGIDKITKLLITNNKFLITFFYTNTSTNLPNFIRGLIPEHARF